MHIFNHLSWNVYLITAVLVLAVYYTYMLLRLYGKRLQLILTKAQKLINGEAPDPLLFQDSEGPTVRQDELSPENAPGNSGRKSAAQPPAVSALLAAIDELTAHLGGEPHHPVSAVMKYKALLNEHNCPELHPYRDIINHTIAGTCTHYGITLLNDDDVDEWW